MIEINYVISKRAIQDIEEIWLYTSQKWSVEQADRYYRLLINEIHYISENFETGRSIEYIRKDYKVSKVKSHLIFYRKSQDNKVEVIRILHQRMDVETRINE